MSMQNIKRLPRSIHGPLRSSIVMFDLPRVVEELVYNSLDACATKVFVFVNVRSCYIKIEDDGRGITREELVILGENYATSKSGLLDDMKANDHCSSFKGAAFLSLSEISIVEVRTKARGNPNAYCKIIKGSRCLFLGIDDQREGVGTTEMEKVAYAYFCENNDDEENMNLTLWLCGHAVGFLMMDFNNISLSKSPCMTSEFTGAKWIGDILYGHPERCKRMMRMEARDFLQLCYNLEHHYDLKPYKNMGVVEKTSILVFTLAQGGSNRRVQERFQHSGETISRIFHDVLCAVCKLAKDIIKPADPEFKDISPQILNDIRYMPRFKDCIRALDGTHIDVIVPIAEQVRYIGRKGRPTQNILAVCSFDMKFTYVLAGFEGMAHDSRVLTKAITTPAYEFPRPPPVTVRDLFYNQPVRRRYMQSSSKKVLHCVKKVIMRAALVHPQVFFKLFDTDSEDELLCTVPSSSPLPLVSRMFGELSGSLHEICFSDDMLKLSGYISRPGGVLSTKGLQYLYVNSRFVSNGSVHNLLNNVASNVLSSLALHESGDPMMHGGKKQKVQDNPAFILNLRCPLSHYDLHFEPSKTIIEFKDWDTILTFFEKAVRHSWQQHLALSLQGNSFSQRICAPTYSETRNKGTSLSDIAKSFDATTRKSSNQMFQDLRHMPKTIPLDFASEDNDVSQDHRRLTRHMKILSNSEPFQVDTDCSGRLNSRSYFHSNAEYSRYDNNIGLHNKANMDSGNSLFLQNRVISHPVPWFRENLNIFSLRRKSCPETVGNLSREEAWSPQSLNLHNAVINAQEVELASPSNCALGKSGSESGGSCFLMQNMNCDSGYDSRHSDFDVRFGLSRSDLFLCDNKDLVRPKYSIRSLNSINQSPWKIIVGSVPSFHTIRKCQSSENVNMSSLDFNRPCSFNQCCLSNGQRIDIGVQELEMSSRCGSPSLCAWHPKSCRTVFDPEHKIAFEENLLSGSETWPYHKTGRKDKLLSSIQDGSAGIHPPKSCTVTKLDGNHSSNPMIKMQRCYPSNEIAFKDAHLSVKMNDEMSLFNPDTSDFSSTVNDFKPKFHAEQKGNVTDGNIWYEQQFQSRSLPLNYEERSRRSKSAPPFYRGKCKYSLLCGCLTAVAVTKPSSLDSKKLSDSACSLDFPSPVYAHQSCPQPIQSQDSPSCFIVPGCKKSSTFVVPSSYREVQEYSASQLAKWRSGARQTTDEVISHEASERINDILDISSGILHFSGDSLVPERIDKDNLNDTRVLLQLDKKFIPVMAGEILLIIDQHAADERIRLEELRRQVLSESGEGRGITYLDSEEELVLPEMGFQLLQKYAEKIEKWGWIFDIHNPMPDSCNKNLNLLTRKRPGVALVAVPCILGINLTHKDLLEYIEQLVETDGSSTLPPSVHRILNFKACRGAIMFGDSLLPSECSLIVDELKATSLCFQCAHGRPTMVPLLNMSALRLQLAKLEMNKGGSKGTSWHGLCHQRPSVQRAQLLLDSAKRFHNG